MDRIEIKVKRHEKTPEEIQAIRERSKENWRAESRGKMISLTNMFRGKETNAYGEEVDVRYIYVVEGGKNEQK